MRKRPASEKAGTGVGCGDRGTRCRRLRGIISTCPADKPSWLAALVIAALAPLVAQNVLAQQTESRHATAAERGQRAAAHGDIVDVRPGGRAFASPILERRHWARAALRRLHAHALLPPGFDPSTTTLTRREAARMFNLARAAAEERGLVDVARLAKDYRDRFAEEFRATVLAVEQSDEEGPPIGFQGGSAVAAGFEGRQDALLTRGLALSGERTGPTPAPDVSDPAGQVELGLHLHPEVSQFAAHASVRREMGEWTARETYGIVALGDLGFWFGRRATGFGPGTGGGLVLTGTVPQTGAGLFLTDGVRLPSVLRHLGSWRIETFVSRPEESGTIEDPWFFGLRASLAPHRRVRIGLNRGALFAGSNNEIEATFGRVVRTLAGIEVEGTGNFENQIGALDIWVAPPLGDVPLALYGEYAIEDLGRSVTHSPAFLVGVNLAALPGVPEAGLGFEVTNFAGPTDGPTWYDHRVFGTWTADGKPLGHPLAGTGTEWRLYTDVDALNSKLRLRSSLFWRDRDEENLFAPDRLGEGWGVGGRAEYRLASHLDLVVRGETESGDVDWSQGEGFAGVRLLF